jgi:hypothetical protein
VRDPVSSLQLGIGAALADETAVVLQGLRAGLTPLTTEMVQRVAALERAVDGGLSATTALLRDDMAVLFDAVASLQCDLAASPAEPAVDVRS